MTIRDRLRYFPTQYPDLVFWVCYLTLNFLLFLPLYLFNFDSSTFLPLPTASANNPLETIQPWISWRNNLDIFRLNAELLLLVAVWVYLPWLRRSAVRRLFLWFFGLGYFMMLGYALYESAMLSIYHDDPVFYSHFHLAVEGLPVLFRNLQLPLTTYLLAGAGFTAGVVMIGQLIGLLIAGVPLARLSRWSKGGLALIALLVLGSIAVHQDALASPKMEVSSFIYKLRQNIADSVAIYHRIHDFDDTAVQNRYNYAAHKLLQKPNIYLIFIESYGSVLYKRPDYRQAYTTLLTDLWGQLQENNWHVASALSEAPTWGGGSWMSYTSTLFGLRVDTQPQFLSLVDRYQTGAYPDLGHYLKGQGYEYIRFSSLSVELDEEKQLQLKNFYGIDRWLDYSDLDFNGPHFGWGPAPPDQYVLFYAYETVLNPSDKPFLFFYMTQNSHYPWTPLPEMVDNWRTLNEHPEITDISDPLSIPHQEKRQNYLNSINYELMFLTDYIIRTDQADSIFILIGDHQPPQVSRRNDSFATPVHIISRNAAFVDAFGDYGFEPGLAVQADTAAIRHEGFYSMFVRLLLAQYGQGGRALPDYLPQGIPVEDQARQAANP